MCCGGQRLKMIFKKIAKKLFLDLLYEKVIMRNESLLQGQKINIQKHIICVYFFDENFKTCLLKNLFKKIGELRANKIFFLIENYNKIDLYFFV